MVLPGVSGTLLVLREAESEFDEVEAERDTVPEKPYRLVAVTGICSVAEGGIVRVDGFTVMLKVVTLNVP